MSPAQKKKSMSAVFSYRASMRRDQEQAGQLSERNEAILLVEAHGNSPKHARQERSKSSRRK